MYPVLTRYDNDQRLIEWVPTFNDALGHAVARSKEDGVRYVLAGGNSRCDKWSRKGLDCIFYGDR